MMRWSVAGLVLLVAALSYAAVYSFHQSFAYPYVQDAVSGLQGVRTAAMGLVLSTVVIGAMSLLKRWWFLGVMWLVLLACLSGAMSLHAGLLGLSILLGLALAVRKGDTRGFAVALMILHFPSLMAFSSADWLWLVPDFSWESGLSPVSVSVLSGFLMIGYLALRWAVQFRKSAETHVSWGYEPDEVAKWYAHRLAFAWVLLLGAGLVAGIVLGVSTALDRAVGGQIAGLPAGTVVFGVGGSVLLIAAVCYILIGRKPA